jgi:CheY-like chemotaxis protein
MSSELVMTRALLVCREPQTIESLCHSAQQIGIHVEICSDSVAAASKVCHSKFEAVIIDLGSGPGALELITKLHGTPSHKKAVLFAICDGEEQRKAAFQTGATLILEKDFSPVAVLRTFRAAYPMMVAERRRYFRYPIETPLFVKKQASPEFRARSVNLSEGGMAISCAEPLSSGDYIQLRICLPGTTEYLTLPAEVRWTDAEGQAGVEFQRVAPAAKERLQDWLVARFEECTPPFATKGS